MAMATLARRAMLIKVRGNDRTNLIWRDLSSHWTVPAVSLALKSHSDVRVYSLRWGRAI
eukprot:CAMPEP_0119066218 /NCGR_PEP_ID=MMETSP1178-20130426/8836_1 /TAXON_ID=33656 /ORGANISM="unid sp, Strain CCMP2000" /LENGTH=58 /DNA_ID=CAMNT_0007047799 /DNA_START=183 /DNA_END=359 /DNA_ORIENTATION=-